MISILKNEQNLSYLALMAATVGLAVVCGILPIQMSIFTVFLFAGPHNFVELRYLFSRLPVRYSKLRIFFLTAALGILLLAGSYISLSFLGRTPMWQIASTGIPSASTYMVWNCALIIWVVALIYLRGREDKRKDWRITYAVALLIFALNVAQPQFISLSIAYLHPFVALAILYCEIKKLRPGWLSSYRRFLFSLPILLAIYWGVLYSNTDLPVWNPTTRQILQHAGSDVATAVSTHLLVATHTFLELLHYAVWLIAIPLVAKLGNPLKLAKVPLSLQNPAAPKAMTAILFTGALAVVALFVCFGLQFPTTRYIYFSFAIIHVVAEIPLLLRLI